MTAIDLASDREPWSRQPRESEKSYAAFQRFLAQDPPRSIARLADEIGDKSAHHLYQWSGRNRWQDRAIHYDGMLRRASDQALIESRKEMNQRHAQLAKAMSAKVAARISSLQPSELTPGELGRWMQVISMVERLALGEVTERIDAGKQADVQVNVGVAVQEVQQPLDATYIGEVMDRLAALGVVPEPLDVPALDVRQDD